MNILFDGYEKYKKAQVEKNVRKFKTVWAKRNEMYVVANAIMANGHPSLGICHGVRNGWEVRELRRLLSCNVVGTDISPTAANIEYCVTHDFHESCNKWVGMADFVYSNSLDHAYDPQKALTIWYKQLKPSGMIFVGWLEKSGIDMADCFTASHDEIELMLSNYGKAGRINVGRKGYLIHWVRTT